jgi:hypothetical protein
VTISVDHGTRVIFVPQADLTPIGPSLYLLDTNQFRLWLKDWEDDEGMQMQTTHRHNTEVTLGGVTLARTIEIINGYTVTFENGMYAVQLAGSNNNIADVTNVNSVSIRSNNSAGLTSEADPQDVASAVLNSIIENSLSMQESMRLMMATLLGKNSGVGTGIETFRDTGDSTNRVITTLDEDNNRVNVTLDPS